MKVDELDDTQLRKYKNMLSYLNRSEEWGAIALEHNTKDNIEKYGFNGFKTNWFKSMIDYEYKKEYHNKIEIFVDDDVLKIIQDYKLNCDNIVSSMVRLFKEQMNYNQQ